MSLMSQKLNTVFRGGLAVIIMFGLLSGLLSAEDFAPKVNPPKNLTDRSFWIKTIEAWKVPSASEVGAEIWPSANA